MILVAREVYFGFMATFCSKVGYLKRVSNKKIMSSTLWLSRLELNTNTHTSTLCWKTRHAFADDGIDQLEKKTFALDLLVGQFVMFDVFW